MTNEELWELSSHMWKWKAAGKVNNYGINPFPYMSIAHIAFILGYENSADMYNKWTPKSSTLVKQMMGDHGLTIYKALLAQAIDREEQKHAD